MYLFLVHVLLVLSDMVLHNLAASTLLGTGLVSSDRVLYDVAVSTLLSTGLVSSDRVLHKSGSVNYA